MAVPVFLVWASDEGYRGNDIHLVRSATATSSSGGLEPYLRLRLDDGTDVPLPKSTPGTPGAVVFLQRDRARAFARQSVPNISQSGQNCTAPPLPIAPGDTMGGQPTASCSCHFANRSETALSLGAFAAILAATLLTRRRRERER